MINYSNKTKYSQTCI